MQPNSDLSPAPTLSRSQRQSPAFAQDDLVCVPECQPERGQHAVPVGPGPEGTRAFQGDGDVQAAERADEAGVHPLVPTALVLSAELAQITVGVGRDMHRRAWSSRTFVTQTAGAA
jgi:hypothetical protein